MRQIEMRSSLLHLCRSELAFVAADIELGLDRVGCATDLPVKVVECHYWACKIQRRIKRVGEVVYETIVCQGMRI
jgi:hypothetical protein